MSAAIMQSADFDTLVIGAGAAGLATDSRAILVSTGPPIMASGHCYRSTASGARGSRPRSRCEI